MALVLPGVGLRHPGGEEHLPGRAQPGQLGEEAVELGGLGRRDQIRLQLREVGGDIAHRLPGYLEAHAVENARRL